MLRRPPLLCALFFAVLACGGATDDSAETPWLGKPCIPGTKQGCICSESGLAGVRICGESGRGGSKWIGCDCGTAAVCRDDACFGPDGGGGPLVAPAVPTTRCELAGGASLQSAGFRLKLFVAPARPVQKIKGKEYSVILGPAGTAGMPGGGGTR